METAQNPKSLDFCFAKTEKRQTERERIEWLELEFDRMMPKEQGEGMEDRARPKTNNRREYKFSNFKLLNRKFENPEDLKEMGKGKEVHGL